MKDSVHRLQSPALVQYDPVAEESPAIENDPSIMEIGKQMFRRTNTAFFAAQLLKVLLAYRTMSALLGRQRCVAISQNLEPALSPQASRTDRDDALLVSQPSHRVG